LTYQVTVRSDSWRLKKPFQISREVHTYASVIVCELSDGEFTGHGEAAGVSYNGETTMSICSEIESVAEQIVDGISRDVLQSIMPPGGARNAVDCAMWDLESKRSGKTIWQLLDRQPAPVTTVYTVGIDSSKNMQKDALEYNDWPIIKVKVGIGDPIEQIAAIREGASDSIIVVDANQAWTFNDLKRYTSDLKDLGVKMIEPQVAGHLVVFAPPRSQFAESALSAIPALIVDVANCISPHAIESQSNDLTVDEFRKLKWVCQERKRQRCPIDTNINVRSVGFGVPSVVQLRELSRHRNCFE